MQFSIHSLIEWATLRPYRAPIDVSSPKVPLLRRAQPERLFLVLLATAAASNSMVVTYASYYIVASLNRSPLDASLYAGTNLLATIYANRKIGAGIDRGAPLKFISVALPLVFILSSVIALLTNSYIVIIAVCSIMFGFSMSFVTLIFSLARVFTEKRQIDTLKYNAYLRASNSLGWMIGPSAGYFIASSMNDRGVFITAALLGLVLLLLSVMIIPGDRNIERPDRKEMKSVSSGDTCWAIRYAAAVCFFFAVSHTLCASALPLFYIREAGLPKYSPGLSFAIKTLMEVVIILLTPMIIRRFGAKYALSFAAMVALLAFFVLSHAATISWVVVGAVLEGTYYGIFAGVGISFVQSFAKDRIGAATSLYMNSLLLGSLIAGPAVGMIAELSSFRSSIQLAAIGVIIAFIMLVFWPTSLLRSSRL